MAEDLKPDQRLTDDEVLAQITTFVSDPAYSIVGSKTKLTADACWKRNIIHCLDMDIVPLVAAPRSARQATVRID